MFEGRTTKEKVGFALLFGIVAIVLVTLAWFQGQACAPYAPGEGPAYCVQGG